MELALGAPPEPVAEPPVELESDALLEDVVESPVVEPEVLDSKLEPPVGW